MVACSGSLRIAVKLIQFTLLYIKTNNVKHRRPTQKHR